ncbi:MAG TPA: hypothetical protein VG167_11745 [Verrucomicrobiae bacterium]|nr:hypothetical protein [Verrucomicrobiae bacterium]
MSAIPPEPPNKPRRGCLFYGCFTLSLFFLAILLAALLGVYRFRRMVVDYTDTTPRALPVVALAPGQLEQLERRVDVFRDAVNARRTTEPLVLTTQEVNALISADPDFAKMKGKVYVKSLERGRATVMVSLPLADLGFAMFRGRYLNATMSVAVQFQNGLLDARADAVSAKGKPLTGMYLNKVRTLNLAAAINENARASVGLNRLQSIQLQEGQVTLVPKEER